MNIDKIPTECYTAARQLKLSARIGRTIRVDGENYIIDNIKRNSDEIVIDISSISEDSEKQYIIMTIKTSGSKEVLYMNRLIPRIV